MVSGPSEGWGYVFSDNRGRGIVGGLPKLGTIDVSLKCFIVIFFIFVAWLSGSAFWRAGWGLAADPGLFTDFLGI